MVTQKDVADLAGVSFITVSRVVNGEQNVKEETKKKVLAAIDKLGYTPNFAGQVLNSGRCNTIAILTPIPFEKSTRTFYLMQVLSGIEELCRKNEIDMILGTVPEVTENTSYDYLRPFKQKKVDGIIYIGLKKIPKEMLEELKKRDRPCVVIGDRPRSSILSWVDTDNFKAGYDTVQKIWEYGHRTLAFISLEQDIYNENIAEREKGFIKALNDLKVPYSPEDYILRTDYDASKLQDKIAEAVKKWKKKPTAVFCSMDSVVPGTVEGFVQAGFSVPEDISIVGFDGFINNTNYQIKIATNVQPLKEMGKKAAEILFSHINGNVTKKQTAVFQVEFTPNDSLRKR
ncbi:MAG: LacI family transcriptional regulator [Treponema sp.]|nr:LacI family transcriptional regulator [Treponema sp.]